MERWRQYFQNLLTDPNITGTEITHEWGELEKDTERTEEQGNKNEPQQLMMVGKTHTERLKHKRLPGPENIITQILKIHWEITEVTLHKTVYQIWKEGIIPEQQKDGLNWHVHKKRDWLELNNDRGIIQLNIGYRIFSNILYECLQPYVENIVGQYQCGLRKGK